MARLRPTSWFEVLACRTHRHAQLGYLLLFLLIILPFHGYSCMRKANSTRAGWGVGVPADC